jgi:hypothetical protein
MKQAIRHEMETLALRLVQSILLPDTFDDLAGLAQPGAPITMLLASISIVDARGVVGVRVRFNVEKVFGLVVETVCHDARVGSTLGIRLALDRISHLQLLIN